MDLSIFVIFIFLIATNYNKKYIKMVHRWQLGVSCGILTAVWTNLYVNYTRLQIAKDKKENK